MRSPWKYAMDYSYEEAFALGAKEAIAETIQRLYERGFTAEAIAFVLELSVPEIISYTESIYTVQ